jgi:hydroxyacylglutathione hydrolase
VSGLVVHQFPCLADNYGFLIHDAVSGLTACVDTPDANAIQRELAGRGWRLDFILNTHHHADHAGGNLALKAATGCRIVGAAPDAARIPGIDVRVADGESFRFGTHEARVIETPGHTVGHICYAFGEDRVAFVGDTLFAMGCGRLFEGTPAQMWASLNRLAALPNDTRLYCAHEYTQANGRFALTLEPDNAALIDRMREVDACRAVGQPTVPTTVALEKATNPFLRAGGADEFATRRRQKDAFR